MIINVNFDNIEFCMEPFCENKLKLSHVEIEHNYLHVYYKCFHCDAEYEVLYERIAEKQTMPARTLG